MAQRKSWKYRLVEIDTFDARRGYKRCAPPGVGVYMGRRGAIADFWRARDGSVVVRFSSDGYIYHLKASLVSGRQVPEDRMDEFGQYVTDILLDWLIEGVDELPDCIYD